MTVRFCGAHAQNYTEKVWIWALKARLLVTDIDSYSRG